MFHDLVVLLLLLLLLPSQSTSQQPCTPHPFFANRVYSTCITLPRLSASLRFTFDSSSSTLSLAFAAPSPGWAAWALGRGMAGAQALIAFRHQNGTVGADTFSIVGYSGPITPSKILFDVWELEAEAEQYGGLVALFAKVQLPPGVRSVNQVWQVGPMMPDGSIGRHRFEADNLQAVGSLDLVTGQSSLIMNGNSQGLSDREIHGILNAVSWGILLPIGAMIARWLKEFTPFWFYLHVSCQIVGYSIGVAGWGTGLKLGSESAGITFTTHRNIAIALFCLATLQVFALFMRPKKEHRYRAYWNAYHHYVGYVVVLLGIYNVFRGLAILNPDHRWRDAYIAVLCCLAVVAVLLELRSWSSSSKPTEQQCASIDAS